MSTENTEILSLKDVLYDKTYECPSCGFTFTTKAIRSGKNQLINTDADFYSTYSILNPILYEVILCNNCGYSSLSKTFDSLLPAQRKWIKEQITPYYKKRSFSMFYTIEDAIFMHKMALLSSMTKKGKIGEQAFIALHTAWLYRELKDAINEKIFLEKAVGGFKVALESERFPIFTLDEVNTMYLIAYISYTLNLISDSKQYLSLAYANHPSPRTKDRMDDLKELLKMS